MTALGGGKIWFTAAEIADLSLPGLPRTKRKVNERADIENWALATAEDGAPLARARKGRGGGVEYHLSILPDAARAELVKRGVSLAPAHDSAAPGIAANDDIIAGRGGHGQLWSWFDAQSDKVKDEARRRAMILNSVGTYVESGLDATRAVQNVAASAGVSVSTIWNWSALVRGVPAADRLPHLAPRRKGGGKEAAVDGDLWQMLLSDYLRLARPSFLTCYRRVEDVAKTMGLSLPHAKTLQRKLEAEVPAQVITLRRKGVEALRKMLPPQIRSVADLHAMELVNIDGHKADVFVNWGRDANGKDIIRRPIIVAIQDVHSRKFLAWRVAESEDMVTARLVFADLFRKWGIPKGLLADNGRAFASKWLTGGSRTRFRFKIREEDPVGLLVNLGVTVHWAKPYRGQSKPIERGFRDFCDAIARHPAFEGAYTGNTPLAKPENYGSKAVDLETFIQVFDAGVAEHNRRLGRRTEMGAGQHSFDDVFAASYARSTVARATEEQLRLALFAADQVSTDRTTGSVKLAGNSYWTEQLAAVAGEKVTIRFDPEDLMQPVHVYDRAGRFLSTAPIQRATGFLDMGQAKERQRLERRHQRATREAAEALNLLSAAELVSRLPAYDEDGDNRSIRPAATRIVRQRGANVAALKAVSEPTEAQIERSNLDRAFGRAALRLIDNN